MSDIGDIIDAIISDIGTAISGVSTEKENLPVSSLTTSDLPHVRVIDSEFGAEALDFRQELHSWTVTLQLVQAAGTRESLELKIEAIRDQIFSDPTLGGVVDRAVMQSAVPRSQPDAERLQGSITVVAEKVKN